MSDVIKMVRPPPRNDKGEADAVREALYGYLIGKNVDCSKLPPLTQAFEAWKKNDREPLPDVPFEMLTRPGDELLFTCRPRPDSGAPHW